MNQNPLFVAFVFVGRRHALPSIAMKSSAWWRELQLAAPASAVVRLRVSTSPLNREDISVA
jgi:hypothetical protein